MKKNLLTHLLALAVMTMMSLQAMALDSERMALGATFDYAWKHNQAGFGVKFQYRIVDHVRIEPEMKYFPTHDDVSTLHLSLNVHNLLDIASDRKTLYPFVGLAYTHWGYVGPDESRVGANLGCGIEYRLNNPLSVFAEQRVQLVSHETQAITSLGVKYRF